MNENADVIGEVVSVVNSHDNGGEQVVFVTSICDNGDHLDDDPFYLEHEITVNSYGNCATTYLAGAQLTPEFLRKMADNIENLQKNLQSERK